MMNKFELLVSPAFNCCLLGFYTYFVMFDCWLVRAFGTRLLVL